MNLPAGLLPESISWLADALFLLLLWQAVKTAPWGRFRHSEHLHVFLGSVVFLLLIWSMQAGIEPGLNFHLLGGTLLMLMFGWQLALVAVALVLLGITINGGADWSTYALNMLLMGATPILLSYAILVASVRWLPHQFFVYVIVNAYFCAGLVMGMTMLVASLLFTCCGPYSWRELFESYIPFAPFMIFAEGFFTGMMAACMAIMRPEWIWTFDDRRYLAGK